MCCAMFGGSTRLSSRLKMSYCSSSFSLASPYKALYIWVKQTLFRITREWIMYQSIPKPPIPPGQSPGIWLFLSSAQWGIWPKMRPSRWGIWRSYQKVCQRSETNFFDSAYELRSRVIALVDSTRVSLLLLFYIVISWISITQPVD